MKDSVYFTPGQLTHQFVKEQWRKPGKLALKSEYYQNIEQALQVIQEIIKEEKTVYGINTGFGSLASVSIPPADLVHLQKNIVLSHACGTGALISDDIVLLVLLLKINNLAQGYSGIRPELLDALIALYNHQIYPCIPCKGSVGASGDLAPLAHLALPLIGEGEVRIKGEICSAQTGLKQAGLAPLELAAKEGLALLNGLQVSTAFALSALYTSEILFETAILAGSLSVEAARGSHVPFDDRIHKARGHQAQRDVAAMYRNLLADSEIAASHQSQTRVQDPYCLRCQPQIMGAILHQLRFINETLAFEINAVSDNPLIFSADNAVLSGGNFHGEIIAMAADNMALALAETGSNSERRIAMLTDASFSKLPAFLVKDNGLNSGFMIAHVTAAACASDNKAQAFPHSVDSIPTSANQEDHVSMATNAARRLQTMLDNTATILAIELLAACQGLEFLKPLKPAPRLQKIYQKVRLHVEPYEKDRYFAPDIAMIKQLILAGEFSMSLSNES